jgi:hypothetical protein
MARAIWRAHESRGNPFVVGARLASICTHSGISPEYATITPQPRGISMASVCFGGGGFTDTLNRPQVPVVEVAGASITR